MPSPGTFGEGKSLKGKQIGIRQPTTTVILLLIMLINITIVALGLEEQNRKM